MLLVLTGSYDHVHIEKGKKCSEKKKLEPPLGKEEKFLKVALIKAI